MMYLRPEYDAFEDGDEVVVVWLSHWMFGKNEFEDGDKVRINFSVKHYMSSFGLSYGDEGPEYANVREYGISPVYDDGKQKEDALGYYKSLVGISLLLKSPQVITFYNPTFGFIK
ncbi:hypothetical protein Hanom_Chr01g00061021 [Helianthus anomalus]